MRYSTESKARPGLFVLDWKLSVLSRIKTFLPLCERRVVVGKIVRLIWVRVKDK